MNSLGERMKRLIIIAAVWLFSALVMASLLTPVGLAAGLDQGQTKQAVQTAKSINPDGARLFELQCAGCHAQGGNIVRRGKTLKLKALQQYGMSTPEAISQIVAQGKGNMSAYQDRLNPAEIQAVTDYVLERANQGWK